MMSKVLAVFLIIYITYTHGSCPHQRFIDRHIKMTRDNSQVKAAQGARAAEKHGGDQSTTTMFVTDRYLATSNEWKNSNGECEMKPPCPSRYDCSKWNSKWECTNRGNGYCPIHSESNGHFHHQY